jgi:mannose-6-phosphate isomerase-like protein (cupin superfamily)
MIKVMTLEEGDTIPLDSGRGEKIRLVDGRLGTDKIDLHHNTLFPGGPSGRYHRHSKADNVYIVTTGVGQLLADGVTYSVRKGQIIFIPAGVPHALSNPGDEPFGIFEIYAPAGPDFDFIVVDE